MIRVLQPAFWLRRLAARICSVSAQQCFELFDRRVEEGSLAIRVPEFLGTFEIDYRSHILRRLLTQHQYEADLLELARAHVAPDKDVLDLGANVGLFSVFFAKTIEKCRRVLAVEPAPSVLPFLHRNLKRNGVADSIVVFEGIATNSPGRYTLHVIPGMEEYSSLGAMDHPCIQGKSCLAVEVQGETVDQLVEAYGLKPGFIKIDTEGAEYLVLRGAMNTLRNYRPTILSELSDPLLASFGSDSGQVLQFLREVGYRVRSARAGDREPRPPFVGEVLAIPEGRD